MRYQEDGLTLYEGDALSVLASLEAESVQCCVTSPPYWGLRDYGTASWSGGDGECDHKAPPRGGPHTASTLGPNRDGLGPENAAWADSKREHQYRDVCGKCGAIRQDAGLGLEATPELYVERMVAVFRELRRVLRADGTLWLNIGDSYCGSWGNYSGQNRGAGHQRAIVNGSAAPNPAYDGLETWRPPTTDVPGLKPKDLVGIPWLLAFALRADGWYLRSDIVWSKPNPMPESVTDRPTKSHEYLFLLAKSERYYFDQDAVREPFTDSTIQRITQASVDDQEGGWKQEQYEMGFPGKKHRDRRPAEIIRAKAKSHRDRSNFRDGTDDPKLAHKGFQDVYPNEGGRNIRTVWTIPTAPSPLPHFAAFPEALVEPCIKAGSAKGDVILDPFAGTGTTLKVARDLGRQAIGIELSPEYCELATQKLRYGVKGAMAIRNGQATLEEQQHG